MNPIRIAARAGAVCLALLWAGCSHNAAASGETVGEKVGGALDEAYDEVRSGAARAEQAGEVAVERTRSGAVCFYRTVTNHDCETRHTVCDPCITDDVRARLEQDPATQGHPIEVKSENGIVTLRGQVPDRTAAARAVGDALVVNGVGSVHSELTWPPA